MNGPMQLPDLFEGIPPEKVTEVLNAGIAAVHEQANAAIAQLVGMAERATGEQMRRARSRSVLDLTVDDFELALYRAQHLHAAVDLLKIWTLPSERSAVPVGRKLKVIPAEVAEEIMHELRVAGAVAS
ncbi:hypothetical protein [Streptomyces hokutonensis]|uniref:hypothetical protein n=1 Tax=Streptomyces hokutonensis TaxID=1306990 RepID=UPI00381A8BEA